MKKKQLALAIALLTTAGIASAEGTKVGLGVSVKSDDTKIYLPIDVSESIRIEPAIQYTHINPDSGSNLDVIEFSVGVFGLAPVSNNVGLYYGARIGYLDIDASFEADGYSLAPTIGLEYWVNERFSISAEAEWSYSSIDGDDGFPDSKTSATDTNLLVRYFF